MKIDMPAWQGAILLAAYVILSSVLGLLGIGGIGAGGIPAEAILTDIWAQAIAADVLFIVGMTVVGLVAWRMAANQRAAASMIVAFVGTWFVYWLSFLTLDASVGLPGTAPMDPEAAFRFVAQWGVFGLLFSALAPAVTWLAIEKETLPSPRGA